MSRGIGSSDSFAASCLFSPPQSAFAQKTTKVWHIGLCHAGLDHEPPGPERHGYVDGKNLNFDWRNEADAAAVARTMKAWVAGRVDLIVGFEDQGVSAAKAVTSRASIGAR